MALPPKQPTQTPVEPKKKEKVDDSKIEALAFVAVSAFPIALISMIIYSAKTLAHTFF